MSMKYLSAFVKSKALYMRTVFLLARNAKTWAQFAKAVKALNFYLKAQKRFTKILRQGFAATATGEYLDRVGLLHGFNRLPGESDTAFRGRLYKKMQEAHTARKVPAHYKEEKQNG
jgi:hypothetical protein